MAFKENNLSEVAITGLPGSGKSRFIESVQRQFQQEENFPELIECSLQQAINPHQNPPSFKVKLPRTFPIWLLMDVRTKPDLSQDQWLLDQLELILRIADLVVFHFVESSGLDEQSFWQKFVQQKFPDLPIIRSFHQTLPDNWLGVIEALEPKQDSNDDSFPAWQSCEFEVGRVSLDHLMMGLANSQQSLGMKIGRVQADLETLEYENLVALEASAFAWNTYASDKKTPTCLRISGLNLDREWLQEIIQASSV